MGLLFYSQGEIMMQSPDVFGIVDGISTTYLVFITKAFLE
jgi:hypothetical protein